MPKQLNTSWGKAAQWYEKVIEDDNSYQKKVILPNLLRLMDIKKGEQVLDLGCGTGFFSREFAKAGAKVLGVDVGKELIEIARQTNSDTSPQSSPARRGGYQAPEFVAAGAENLNFIKDNTQDKIAVVLALQNIEKAGEVIKECGRVLKMGGKLFLVLNHPAFRIPKASEWGWDPEPQGFRTGAGVQYRRVDRYLSEIKIKIEMHPGDDPRDVTWSFHRPLQYYFKALGKSGLAVTRLEEWVSHTKTPSGPRAEAENRARAEFPLFLCLEVVKLR